MYEGRWIAVLNGAIVASGTDAGDIVDTLEREHICDALVTRVPAARERSSYFIG
jgi:hypothetical protein